MKLDFVIDADNFDTAGEASSVTKRTLSKLGVPASVIRKVAISMYEAEINAFIHGGGGTAEVEIDSTKIVIIVEDHGKGIEDISQAMQEGWSTADEKIRSMGFGAGMGLPNMKNNTDELIIDSRAGEGTRVTMTVKIEG